MTAFCGECRQSCKVIIVDFGIAEEAAKRKAQPMPEIAAPVGIPYGESQ